LRAAILTVSSTRSVGDDASGDELSALLDGAGFETSERALVSDDAAQIEQAIVRLAEGCDVLLTTGGTGITPDDVTPEATMAAIDREVPGIAEALRAASLEHTPMAMLSRAVAGTRGRTLIVNLPGSPNACRQCFEVLRPVLDHAAAQLNR
jgi:molybdenum cofactor synthesis domain-containing protein